MSACVRALAAWVALAATVTSADDSAPGWRDPPPVADRPQLKDRYPDRRVSFPGDVNGIPDVVFSSLQGYRPLTLDLYVPSKPRGSMPLLLFVHGGGWWSGHARHAGAFQDWPRVLAAVSARGYVVASVNYRLSAEAAFPAAEFDVKTAISWLRQNADEYSIDASRVGLWATSAGGQLAALAGTSCGEESLALPGNGNAINSCVQAVANWYGVHDFASQFSSSVLAPAVAQYLGCRGPCTQRLVRLASPSTFIDGSDPPFLLIHGALDKTVPLAQSTDFHSRLRAAGVKSRLHVIQGVDHSFIGATPEATRAASLEALKITLEFFDDELRERE